MVPSGATTKIRYRGKLGVPTNTIERILQWLWRWRIELTLFYIVIATTAAVVIELLHVR